MPYKIVPHPETGEPVKEEVTYVTIEKTTLDNEVTASQEAVDVANRELDEAHKLVEERQVNLSKAEAALGEAKSGLASYNEIATQKATDTGTAEPSGEDANTTEEGQEPVPQF